MSRIVSLTAQNFKRLRAVRINPTGNVVQITGANGQGKTSVLDAIFAALGGGKAVPATAVRRGAKTGKVVLDLGDMIVSRGFTAAGGTSLQVEAPPGSVLNSPQRVLDELAAKFTFDPLGFLRQKPAEQLETLRSVVTLEVDVDLLDGRNAKDYADRTELNRQARELRTRAEAITVSATPGAQRVDVDEILNAIENVASANAEVESRKARRAEVAGLVTSHQIAAKKFRDDAAELRRQADDFEKAAGEQEKAAAEQQARLDNAGPLPELQDVTVLRQKFDNGKAVNAALDRRAERDRLEAEAAAVEKKAADLTERMADRDKQKADAIAAAQMPVPGLGFGDGMVTLNGLPFEQASGAEQLRASIGIAMAMNPNLRIMLIRDGSLLDDNGMKLVGEMAETHDFQVWLERVQTNATVGIVMEDGEVAAIDGEPTTTGEAE